MLRGAAIGGAGVAGAVLIGCGGDDDATATPDAGGGGGAATAAPTEAPSGGAPELGPVVTTGVGSNNFFQLDPVTGTGGDEHQFLWQVYDNLVGYDETLTPQGQPLARRELGVRGRNDPRLQPAPRREVPRWF